MATITKQWPQNYNQDLLEQQLRNAGFTSFATNDSGIRIFDVTDDQATNGAINAIIANHNANALTDEQLIGQAQSGLLDKITLAEDYASDIKTLFNATLDHTIAQTSQNARYTALKALIEASPTAFKNRFYADMTTETVSGCTIANMAAIDVVIAALGTLTATQEQRVRDFCQYVRTWSTQLALLLSIRR